MGNIVGFYVYEHWRSDTNQCFYVGKGYGKRAWDFKRNRNKHFKNVVGKVLRNGFRVDVVIVKAEMSEGEAFAYETQLVKQYLENGVSLTNQTSGGEGKSGWKPSPETKKKWSRRFRGEGNPMYGRYGKDHPSFGYRHTEEHKKKMSERFRGENNPMFGKVPPHKGKPSPLRGTKHSEETKRKRSEALRGEKNPMFGKKMSEETRKKMSESQRKRNERIRAEKLSSAQE